MRAKSVILLMVALGSGLVASAGISKMIMDQKAVKEVETTEILVAVKVIEAATKLTQENVKLEAWPKDRLPIGTISDFKEIDGKFAKQPLYEGEPILQKKLMLTNESAAQTIPEGYKIFDLSVDDNMGYIKPGDRVDIFGYFDKKSGKVAESKSMLVMKNVSVHMVDGVSTRQTDDNARKATKTFQLLIRDSQYEALNMASHLCEGRLRLALRPLGTISDDVTDNGEDFLDWIKVRDEQPAQVAAANPLASALLGVASTPKLPEHKITVLTPNGPMVYLLPDDGGIPELVEGENGGGVDDARMMVPSVDRSADRPGGFAPQYPKSPSKGSGKGKDKDEEVEDEEAERESDESEEDSPVLPRKH